LAPASGSSLPTSSGAAAETNKSATHVVNGRIFAGPIVGGILAVTIGLFVAFYFYRRRQERPLLIKSFGSRKNLNGNTHDVSPFNESAEATTQHKKPNHKQFFGVLSSRDLEVQELPTQEDREQSARERQRELHVHMQEIQAEIEALRGEATERSLSRQANDAEPEGNHYAALTEQILIQEAQIAHLRVQLQSAWAMGLSDDPPPAYVSWARTIHLG
jgi:hypothetical protein